MWSTDTHIPANIPNVGEQILKCLLQEPGVVPSGYRVPAMCTSNTMCYWRHLLYPKLHMENIDVKKYGCVVLRYDIRVLNVVRYSVEYHRPRLTGTIKRHIKHYRGLSIFKYFIKKAIRGENIRLRKCVKKSVSK